MYSMKELFLAEHLGLRPMGWVGTGTELELESSEAGLLRVGSKQGFDNVSL